LDDTTIRRPRLDSTVRVRIAFLEFADGITRTNAWTFLYAAFITIALLGFLNFCQALLLSELVKVPKGEVGRVIGFATTFGEILQLGLVAWVGGLADRIGRRPLYAIGALVTGIGYAAHVFADSLPKFYAARIIIYAGFTLCNVIVAIISADYPTEGSRGKLAGATGLLNGIGISLFAILFAQLPRAFMAAGYTSVQATQYMLWVVAFVATATAGILQFGLKAGTPAAARPKTSGLAALRIGMSAANENRRIMLGFIGSFMSRTDLTIVATFVSLWFQELARNKGMNGPEALSEASKLFGITQGASLLWAGFVGVLIDRFDRVTCVMGALLIAGVGYVLLGLQQDPFGPMGILGCVIVGIGQMSAF
jgi:MFS family permease